jgi:hypothetical protein
MEINNKIVSVSHEATVSKLDKSKLFYLMSKGFDWSQITFLTKENYYFLTQIIYVVLIVLFADKLWKLSKSDIKNIFK